jgi:hypothetical protein
LVKQFKQIPQNKLRILIDNFKFKRIKQSDIGIGTTSESEIGPAEGGIKEDTDKDVQEEASGEKLYKRYINTEYYIGIKQINDKDLNTLSNYLIKHYEININHREKSMAYI